LQFGDIKDGKSERKITLMKVEQLNDLAFDESFSTNWRNGKEFFRVENRISLFWEGAQLGRR
jgi:hypothetical protein